MSTPAWRFLFVAILYNTNMLHENCTAATMVSEAVRYDAHRCGVVPDVGVRSMKSSLEMKAREQRPQKSAFLDLSNEVTS